MKTNVAAVRRTGVSVLRSFLWACFIAMTPLFVFTACEDEEEEEPHVHTQAEEDAYAYLGYYPCEQGITDFSRTDLNKLEFMYAGVKEGNLWFAFYDTDEAKFENEWTAPFRFQRDITYLESEGASVDAEVEDIEVARITRNYSSSAPGEDHFSFAITLKYTLENGKTAYQTVMMDEETEKSGMTLVTEKSDVLRMSPGNSVVVHDMLYTYDGILVHFFSESFGLPLQNYKLEQFYQAIGEGNQIYELTSHKLTDTECLFVDYMGEVVIWRYNFVEEYFQGMEIRSKEIYRRNAQEIVINFKVTENGEKKAYDLHLGTTSGNYIDIEENPVVI